MLKSIVFASLILLSTVSNATCLSRPSECRKPLSIYRCNSQLYDPPCRKVAADTSVVETQDWAQLIAASRAARTKVPTPVIRDDGPIAQCGNGHGQSACCQIVGIVPDGSGDVIVQCD